MIAKGHAIAKEHHNIIFALTHLDRVTHIHGWPRVRNILGLGLSVAF